MGAVNLAGLHSPIMDSKAALPAGWLDAFAQAHLPYIPEMDARVRPGRALAAPAPHGASGGGAGRRPSGRLCPLQLRRAALHGRPHHGRERAAAHAASAAARRPMLRRPCAGCPAAAAPPGRERVAWRLPRGGRSA